jgi:V-type H+-transporting ATPase subunit C
VRSLNDIIKKEHIVQDSEYLLTLVVAVPKSLDKEWKDCYETLTQMVVPRSSVKVEDDGEFGLYTVVLFKRVEDEFTAKARENK